MAFVYDIDLAAFSVAEYKEGVVEHIHLQDASSTSIGFTGKRLVLTTLYSSGSYISSTKSGVKAAAFIPFFQLGFVFDNLTEQGVNDGFQSIFAFISRSFGTEEKTF